MIEHKGKIYRHLQRADAVEGNNILIIYKHPPPDRFVLTKITSVSILDGSSSVVAFEYRGSQGRGPQGSGQSQWLGVRDPFGNYSLSFDYGDIHYYVEVKGC